jgi:hypothetical protein
MRRAPGMGRSRQADDAANPLRPVDWRWRRATGLVDGGELLSPETDDGKVRDAARFVTAWRGCEDEGDRARLAREVPALYGAHQLYLASGPFEKWEVEARLLTDEPYAQIGGKRSLDPQVVEAFHNVFFDVRDRLHAEGYILHVVIGPKAHTGLTESDIDVILKMFAYAGGPLVVDALVGYYRGPPVAPERPEELGCAELQELRTKLLLKALILSHTLPATVSGMRKMAVLSEAVQGIQSALRTGGEASSPLLASTQTGSGAVPNVTPPSRSPLGTAASSVLVSPPLAAAFDPLVAA